MRDLLLAAAAAGNDLAEVTTRLGSGASPDSKDVLGYTPLILASARGHFDMVRLLLTAGADVQILDDQVGASALHRAAQCRMPEVVHLLASSGAHLDLQAPLNGHTPLIDAVWHKRDTVVAALIDEGARLDVVARRGYTALDLAERDGLDEIAALLIAAGGERERAADQQMLIAAVTAGDVDRVGSLVHDPDVDVNTVSPDGFTALMIASQDGRADIVRLLVDAGADARLVDPLMLATPGHKAGYRGHPEVARVLCEASNLDLDAQGPYNGYTALHDAVWHGHTEAAEWFIKAGARLDLEGLDGRTPVAMAREYGYDDLVARLERAAEERAS